MKGILIFLFVSFTTFAQQTFYLKDKANNNPIVYTSIYNDKGTFKINSELDGSFIIPDEFKNDTFIIESIGYKTNQTELLKSIIYLNEQSEILDELIIIPRLGTKEIKVGFSMKNKSVSKIHFSEQNVKSSTYFGNKNTVDFENFPFIKEIHLKTQSKINDAKFAIRIYNVNDIGEPNQLIHQEPIYGFAKKGTSVTTINIENLYLQLNSRDFFVFFEPLFINENAYRDKDYHDNEIKFYYPRLSMVKDGLNFMWIGYKFKEQQKWTESKEFYDLDNTGNGFLNFQIEVTLTN